MFSSNRLSSVRMHQLALCDPQAFSWAARDRTVRALEYAKSIAPDHVTAVYVDLDEEATRNLREKWKEWADDVNLVVLASPYRALTRPPLRYIDLLERDHKDDIVTVILPEFVPAKWWQQLLHTQSSLMLKGALLSEQGLCNALTNVNSSVFSRDLRFLYSICRCFLIARGRA